jgi:translocation and assembly module TamB
LELAKAVVYDEPLDRVALRATYTDRLIDVPRLEIVDGPARIEGSLTYNHTPGDLENGQARFKLTSTNVSLARLHTVQKLRPGLAGTLEIAANGAADIRKQKTGAPQVLFSTLDANVGATGLELNRYKLGDLRLAAQTSGDRLNYKLNSDLAGSAVTGSGETTLRGDYATTAQLHFSNVTYTGLRPLISPETVADPLFEAAVDGEATVNGPLLKTDALSGRFSLTRLVVSSKTAPASGVQAVTLRNDGLITVSLNKSLIRVEQARIVGPQTQIVLAGTAGLETGQALDLTVNADTNLGLLQQMTRNFYSSGQVVLQAAVRGTMTKPSVNGRMELKNASLNYIDYPNGISNANGLILFSGNSATIQTLTAESGGGKLTASGFVSYGGPSITYGLKANANSVRVRYPPGASVVASAQVNLTGTTQRSLLGGNVTIEKIGFSPQSDFGSMLANTSQPAQSPSAPSGPIAGMRMEIRIRTAPDVSVQSSLAQNVQATADLTMRGTASSPGMIGRVTITQGDLVFFGSKYTVTQGSVTFYDPNRIVPVLNVDLETVAKGVTVDLNVAGPVDNMKLTYHSDPPLQFNEIVALLATGRTPTSDPNIVARQPPTPPESLQQMGESALISQAIANPVASRLQRVFGVSQLKIDPTFTSGSSLPQARLTLQQQISSNLTFTYIQNVTQTNSQIVRIEWAFNPRWSAVATRDENGVFGVDVFYKRSFR